MNKSVWKSLGSDHRRLLIIIIVAALIFRIVTALISDNFNHPDENFQVMEQAHRLVFGHGFIPWEYRYDARSWIVPGIMAGFLYPFKLIGLDNPNIYIPGIKILLGFISLLFIVSAFHIGVKLNSIKSGLWAAFLAAVWYEMIYFSIKPLGEMWSALFYMTGLALYLSASGRKYVVVGSFLVCLAMAVRINYIPVGILTLFLFATNFDRKQVIYTGYGIIGAIVFVGLFETITLGTPFVSYYNIYEVDKSFFMEESFGSAFSFGYLFYAGFASLFLYWLFWIAGLLNRKKSGKIALLCLVLLLSHVLIPAKPHEIDYRNIFLIIPLSLICGGAILALFQDRINSAKFERTFTCLIAFIVIGISVTGAFAKLPNQKYVYDRKPIEVYNHSIFYNNPRLKAYRYLAEKNDVHGVMDNSDLWFRSGGYYYLHREIPLYFMSSQPSNAAFVSHVISKAGIYIPPEFRPIQAFDSTIIYKRVDSAFVYVDDNGFDYDIIQSGVDDNPRLIERLK